MAIRGRRATDGAGRHVRRKQWSHRSSDVEGAVDRSETAGPQPTTRDEDDVKIVVTGALGHIGSRVIRDLPRLLPASELVLIDNLMTQRYASLFALPAHPRCRFIECDVIEADLSEVIADAVGVIHLAAITDATRSFERKEEVEYRNLAATASVAKACAAAGVPMLFPSSTSVYGSQTAIVDEDSSIDDLRPQSPYAETKLREESHLAELAESAGLRFVTCRFGTIFGTSPGMRFHTAVNKFCWQAAMGQPLTVWQTAYDQKRPYLDLSDATRAIAHIIASDLFDGRIYNVVSLNTTVRNVVDTIRRHISCVEVKFVDERVMNQLSYEVDNARFAQTGFRVEGDLDRSIRDTVALLRGACNE